MSQHRWRTIPVEDGDIRLLEGFLDPAAAYRLMDFLLDRVSWEQPVITLFGRRIRSPRRSAWFGDRGANYRYSAMDNSPLPWLPPLAELRHSLEAVTGARFNSVLANLYRDGNDAMGWHSDDERELGHRPVIASVSIGAVRRFRLRHRSRRDLAPVSLDLAHGSLLLMAGNTQTHWKHAVMRTRRTVGPRINLTYRRVSIDAPTRP